VVAAEGDTETQHQAAAEPAVGVLELEKMLTQHLAKLLQLQSEAAVADLMEETLTMQVNNRPYKAQDSR
tara:strand:+ start:310 stop:516 length:207 start_codon:yes stop_codon:yes gene_type:complete